VTRYVIAERRMVQRPHIDGGGLSQETWVPAPVYGQHETRTQAKAHYMRRLDPGLRRVVDDAFCARHFDQRARNIGDVKVVKA